MSQLPRNKSRSKDLWKYSRKGIFSLTKILNLCTYILLLIILFLLILGKTHPKMHPPNLVFITPIVCLFTLHRQITLPWSRMHFRTCYYFKIILWSRAYIMGLSQISTPNSNNRVTEKNNAANKVMLTISPNINLKNYSI